MYLKSLCKNGFEWDLERLFFFFWYKKVSFDIYQRASDRPILRILKNLKPIYYNEKFLIKDKHGNVLKKSKNLNHLITKTSWNNLSSLIFYLSSLTKKSQKHDE